MAKEILAEKKLHIGYLIYNFFEMEQLFSRRPLFEQYNRNKFEIFIYVDNAAGFGDLVARLPQIHWRNISDDTVEIGQQIMQRDKLDFLIDISGIKHQRFLSILSRRIAPIQACFVGQFNSMKLHTVDYLFTDRFCDPLDQTADYFTETPIYLPQTSFCYTKPDAAVVLNRAPFKQNGYVTFGCFNYFIKLTDDFLRLWASVLQSVPESRLLIKSRIFGSGYGCQETRFRLKRLGFPVDRVEMFPSYTKDEVLYKKTDILLGGYPYQSGYEICDALYHGIPVIQLIGKWHSVRLGYSILKNLGFEECIAFNEDGYVEAAIRLANNGYKLMNVHKNLQLRMEKSALMDGRRFVGSVERIYIQLWREFEERPKLENMKAEMRALLATMNEGLGYVHTCLTDIGDNEAGIMRILKDIAAGTDHMKILVCRHEKLAHCHSIFYTVTQQSKVALKLYRQQRYSEVQQFIENDLYLSIEQLQKLLK